MESVGQTLRVARTRLGITLEQVSAETRITIRILTAIEQDELSYISSPFFYRSFVRQFAEKVKVDFSSISAQLQEAASTLPQPPMPGQRDLLTLRLAPLRFKGQGNLRWLTSLFSFLFVVTSCSGLYAVWQRSQSDWRVLSNNIAAGVAGFPQHFATLAGAIGKAGPAREAPVRPLSGPSTMNSSSQAQPQSGASEFQVQLSAVERTWLSTIADGKETFTGVLDASETKILEWHESARIRTANAGGLSFVFNGKEIGILGPRGQVRTVVFTRNNYRVLPSPTVPGEATPVAMTTLIQNVE